MNPASNISVVILSARSNLVFFKWYITVDKYLVLCWPIIIERIFNSKGNNYVQYTYYFIYVIDLIVHSILKFLSLMGRVSIYLYF